MLNQIFNPENVVFRTLGRAVDVVVLGALWLVCSLPIITLGASTTALYYSMVKCVRRGEERPYANFIGSFRENFRVSAPLSLLAALLWYLLTWGYEIMVALANEQGGAMTVIYMAYRVMLVVPLGTLCYAFPLLSRFTFGPAALLGTAFRLALRHLPTTVVLVLLLVESVRLCERFWYLYFLPLLLCPGVVALLSSFFLERIFLPLTPREEGTNATAEEDSPWYLR